MRLLAIASECFPLVKTGGLADVVGALPGALAPEGIAATTLLPGYPSVLAAIPGAVKLRALPELFGGPARVLAGTAHGLDLLVLEAPHLFDRPGTPYLAPGGGEWEDNALRFAALGATGALLAREEGFDAVHAHDWQAGLALAYLRHGAGRRVPSLFTIHNLAFQGQYPATLFPRLGLPPEAFAMAGLEHYGHVGFLKSGLWYADRITTVSPTYAAEILTPEGGMGLDGLLRGRGAVVDGILNGLDTLEWDPESDARLPSRFSVADPGPRAANKAALQHRMGLAEDAAVPLFAFIGRLAWQKGVDLVLEALPALLEGGAQLAILGSGEAALEARCRAAAVEHPGRVGTFIGFDETVARLLYGGADAVLVPSRFEPCGLTQLCALRYGAPPIVARVGGLADTVIDANEMALAAGTGTGLVFAPGSAQMLAAAMRRAIALWRQGEPWRRLQTNAMACDVSWRRSAGRYAALFRDMVRAESIDA
ncbi:glycogen synthase GlgA [Siccirubricoccus sp. KC 17139]|uniref:Glycogen synthase n=1 Tax=Siccirubricoccus soli TaxID=2899147 RepID=A0ABT1D6A9_9PROT|nr:glycogen synthase GlgA [Siccirubricoccus soli]MCO6416744.1 glycogen synthase GlgA [Siccirubricoccus soli]MCP2682879.1 glycogen synthase GlgA [Siccirubricoccus soli]